MSTAAALSLCLLSCVVSTTPAARARHVAAVDDTRLLHADREPQNWLTYGGSWLEQRYSRLDQVNASNVAQLKPAWSFDFDTTRGQEATPIVVDGVMYVSTAWSKVYALNAKTGEQLWYFDPKVPGPAGVPTCCDVVNRGVAVYHGKIYVGTIDARLIALDAATGQVVWSAVTASPNTSYSITGAPRAARGKVFIGNAGAEYGGRGYVSAYNAETGKLVWRFYTVPGDPAAKPDGAASDDVLARTARPTWFGDWYKYGGGGHVWNALVFDPDFNQLYMATGNGYPWNRTYRSAGQGDNLFISSIVAVDADTGRYKWHYQEVPGEEWDYDSVADMTLVDLEMGGHPRKVLLHAPKNGFFYVLDRKSGQLLSAEPFVPGVNWATRIDLKTGRPQFNEAARYKSAPWNGVPGGGGAHSWHPGAFSPLTGLMYFPAAENSTYYVPTPDYTYVEGMPNIGVDLLASVRGPASANAGKSTATSAPHGAGIDQASPSPQAAPPASRPSAYLLAWNPVTQRAAWRVNARGNGVLATAGNLVFQGRVRSGLLGDLVAFRADTGEQLWKYETPNAIAAGPMTYSVDGEQFVAASTGASAISFGAQPRARHVGRMVAFKLNGTATLPPEAPLAPPANPPQEMASKADYTTGEQHYGAYCARCHGFDTQSPNVVPDLRRSPMLTDKQSWQEIVIGGALTERGMVSWAKFLTPAQAETVRAYVGEQARALQGQEKAAADAKR